MFHSLVRLPGRALSSVRFRWLTVCASLATGLMLLFPVLADATTKEKVETVATDVGTEGVEIVLAILTALVALIVAVIIIPKAVGLIKRFI